MQAHNQSANPTHLSDFKPDIKLRNLSNSELISISRTQFERVTDPHTLVKGTKRIALIVSNNTLCIILETASS